MRPSSSPPPALISSIASCKPRVIASPDWADAPESAATPIRKGLAMGAASAVHIADPDLAAADLGLTARTLEELLVPRGLTIGDFPPAALGSTLGGLFAARAPGRLTPRHDIDLANTALYWHFLALTVAITFAVIAGFPRVA